MCGAMIKEQGVPWGDVRRGRVWNDERTTTWECNFNQHTEEKHKLLKGCRVVLGEEKQM